MSVADVSDGEVWSSMMSGDVGEGATVVVLQAEKWLRNNCGRAVFVWRMGGSSVWDLLMLGVTAFCDNPAFKEGSGSLVSAASSKVCTLGRSVGSSRLTCWAACVWHSKGASRSVGQIVFSIPRSLVTLWKP